MKYDWIESYCLSKKGVSKDYKEEWDAHRYLLGDKMIAMDGHNNHGLHIFTMKLDISLGSSLRAEYEDISPGYYMNKDHWNSLNLDGSVPDNIVRMMIDNTYKSIFESLSKKVQKEILEG